MSDSFSLASVIIPARNEAARVGAVVRAVLDQRAPGTDVEVIVVDDGSTDGTAEAAIAAGARVVRMRPGDGNPAAARNRGAAASRGDPIVFLDADCIPAPGWLATLLRTHEEVGAAAVGGSLDLPRDLPATARCDYYCTTYHLHSRRQPGKVLNHSPANLSVLREAFFRTRGFTESPPVADGHEELGWQADLMRQGLQLYFEPSAIAYHHNRPGLRNLLRRNYRWGYSALQSKAQTGAARFSRLYRYPHFVIPASIPLVIVHTGYVLACWLRAGVWEPVVMLPALVGAKGAYAMGFMVGGSRWLRGRGKVTAPLRPRWR